MHFPSSMYFHGIYYRPQLVSGFFFFGFSLGFLVFVSSLLVELEPELELDSPSVPF